jgi:hypothetical protein
MSSAASKRCFADSELAFAFVFAVLALVGWIIYLIAQSAARRRLYMNAIKELLTHLEGK